MTSSKPEKAPQGEECIRLEAKVWKTTSTLKSKGLAEKLVKMILLPQDWEDRKAHPMEEIIKSFFPALVKISAFNIIVFLNTQTLIS